jgi:hypothetical protein
MDMPGTLAAISSTEVMPSLRSWSPLMAVMLMAVSCTVELRFSAVTTISSSPPPESAVGPTAVAAKLGAASEAPQTITANRLAALYRTLPSALHDFTFIDNSP